MLESDPPASTAYGLMFHYFHDGERHPVAQGTVSAPEFEESLDRFASGGKLLGAGEWAFKADRNELREGEACLTFDDGLRCQADVALPALKERGLTAFWFPQSNILTGDVGLLEVFRRFRSECFGSLSEFYEAFFSLALGPSVGVDAGMPDDYLEEFAFYSFEDRVFRYVRDRVLGSEKYADVMRDLMRTRDTSVETLSDRLFLTQECIRELERGGHVIGLHSHSHPSLLGELSEDRQRLEYETNYEVLSGILVAPPVSVAHPQNSYSAFTLTILRGLGIRLGFRSNMTLPRHSNLEFPRKDISDLILEFGTRSRAS